MKKRVLLKIILFSSLLVCCKRIENKQNLNEKIHFNNHRFKTVLDSFIMNTGIYPVQKYEDILISIYKENKDTILSFENAPPFELKNLKLISNYKDFNIYIYAPSFLHKKMNTLISLDYEKDSNINKVKIDSMDIDMIYRTSYIINGDEIKLRKVPLVWSTDSLK